MKGQTMDRFNFDAAATLAKIRKSQGPRPILPIVPTDTPSRGQTVGTIGTVEGPLVETEKRDAEVIDAAGRFRRRAKAALPASATRESACAHPPTITEIPTRARARERRQRDVQRRERGLGRFSKVEPDR
jgi:hypothetical protein